MKGATVLSHIAKRLEGKVAIITGGASGIGAATAKVFTEHGAKVVIADVQDELGHSVCKEIGADNKDISYVHCDVTNEPDVRNVVNTAVSKHGKLDIMFNNAGIAGKVDRRISEFEEDNTRRIFDVNVIGALLGTKHAARFMVPAKKGSIIFTSSIGAVIFGCASHSYMASKSAIQGLTKNLCVELGQYGIRVNCISPYVVATPAVKQVMGLDKEAAESLAGTAANIKGTTLETVDIANAALYLASDESKYVSGLNLVVDGGFTTTNIALEMAMKDLHFS